MARLDLDDWGVDVVASREAVTLDAWRLDAGFARLREALVRVEEAHEALPPAARERFPLAIRLGGDDPALRLAEAEDLLRRADVLLSAAHVALAKAGITLDCPEDFGAWIEASREPICRAVDRMEGEE